MGGGWGGAVRPLPLYPPVGSGTPAFIVEAEMSQKLSWRDLFVQIELGVDIASLGIK